MKGDRISLEWLYQIAVGFNMCQKWFDNVTDPSVNNRTFEVLIAGVNHNQMKPKRDLNCPPVTYIQNNQDICGISEFSSAFSNAFSYTYDNELALHIYKNRDDSLTSLSSRIMKKVKEVQP